MSQRRKKYKYKGLKKIKRWLSKVVSFSSNTENHSIRRRRRRSKKKPKRNILDELKYIYLLCFKRQDHKRRRRKRPLHKRIYLRANKFTQNSISYFQKLFSAKKKKRRKRKQYAVYVMSNQ